MTALVKAEQVSEELASAILAGLRARGIRLWVVPGPDWTWSPRLDRADLLTEEDKGNLARHRESLIQLLLAEPEYTAEPAMEWAELPTGRCLLILHQSGDREAALRDVRFFEPAPPEKRLDVLICKPQEDSEERYP